MVYKKTIWKNGMVPTEIEFNNFEDGIEQNSLDIEQLKVDLEGKTGVDFEDEDFMHQLEMALFNADLSNNPLMNAGASNSVPRSTQLMTTYKKIIPAINEVNRGVKTIDETVKSFLNSFNKLLTGSENGYDLSELETENKESVVHAINELVGEIKELKQAFQEIANAVSGKAE